MDYEKKYKKALERAATELETCGADESLRNMIYAIFPDELKESEDEQTRKGLINFLKSPFIRENICDWKVAPWIAWLEKQKYTQRDVDDAYLKGVTDTKNELEKQGELPEGCVRKTVAETKEALYSAPCTDTINGQGITNQVSQSEVTKISDKVWSEKDEKMSENILSHLREYYVQKKGYPYVADLNSPEMEEFRWFKTLKKRLGGK